MERLYKSPASVSPSGLRARALPLLAALAVTVAALWVARITLFGGHGKKQPPDAAAHSAVADSGAINVVQPEPIGTDSSILPTPRTLVLSATRPGRNTREGYADIGISELSPQTYQAGALLANGVRLEEIYADYVVLTKESHRARLYVTGLVAPAGVSVADASLLQVGGDPSATQVAAAADTRDQLSEVLRLSPVYDGDTLMGLEIYDNTNSDALKRLGLEPGDRVTAIDGVKVTSPAEGIAQLRQLIGGAAMTVTIERGGKAQTIALDGTALGSLDTHG